MLFDLGNLKVNKALNAKSDAETTKGAGEAMYLPDVAKKALQAAIGELREGHLAHFYTFGAWSLHELVAYCLQQTGPAEVTIMTWTFSETPARSLLALKAEGQITKLTLVVDKRVKTKNPKAFQLLQATSDGLKEARTHAKVVVIRGGKFAVTIIGSANFSTNLRYESGCVFTDGQVAEFHQNWIETICN